MDNIIKLTRNRITIIDQIDSDLMEKKWYCTAGGYALRDERKNGKRKSIYLHRLILSRIIDRPLHKTEVCDHIIVMYGGTIMEIGTEKDIFYNPQNPYTVGLHQSIPKMNIEEKERLIPIKGSPPDLLHPPEGCPFASRCPHTMQVCLEDQPPTFKITETHSSACWLLHEDAPMVDQYETAEEISDEINDYVYK